MIRANFTMNKKQERLFRERAERLAYSISAYVKKLVLDELERLQEEEGSEEN